MKVYLPLLILGLVSFQDDLTHRAEKLIDELRSEKVEVRDEATRRLKELGEAAIPSLRVASREKDPEVASRAARIAAWIEWATYVPLWLEEKDPSILLRLASEDPTMAAAAYDEVALKGGLRSYLDEKVLHQASPVMKRRVFAGIKPCDEGGRRIGGILEVLAGWNTASQPLGEQDVKDLAVAIALSSRAEHRAPLAKLDRHESELLRELATLGKAAIGDPDAQAVALNELKSTDVWRRIAAAHAFKRSPNPQAGPGLLEMLDRVDAPTILAALDALEAYPQLDARASLIKLLDFRQPELQSEALRQIALRKIDESKRIWSLYEKGRFTYKEEGPTWGDHWPGEDSLQGRLAQAILVADDASTLDRIIVLESADPATSAAFETVLTQGAPPRIEARLRAIQEEREKASEDLRSLAKNYFSRQRPPRPTPEQALAILASETGEEAMGRAFDSLLWAHDLPAELKEKYLAISRTLLTGKSARLRGHAATALHRMKAVEGTDVLLELAEAETEESRKYLWALTGEERARALFRKKLKSEGWETRVAAVYLLSQLKDESVPSVVIEMCRERRTRTAGHALGYALSHYPDRDYTEELLAILNETTPPDQVASILEYLHRRGRKDQIKLVRAYVTYNDRGRCGTSSTHVTAITTLGEWRDRESFELLSTLLDSPAHGGDILYLLTALLRIDPDQGRERMMTFLSNRDYQVRWAAYQALFRTATQRDERLILRLLRTDSYANLWLPQIAGRLHFAGAAEVLLELVEGGGGDAALGLAYVGERRAVPILMEHLEGVYATSFLGAMDYVVNREHYPMLADRKDLGYLTSVPFEESKSRIRAAFGIELNNSSSLASPYCDFMGEETLLEWLERNCRGKSTEGRFSHVWRNGSIEFVSLDQARTHWKQWWEAQPRSK
jgi:HEAT repeat protein